MDLVQQLPEGGPKVVGLPISFDRSSPDKAPGWGAYG
jgi:hypothetical protein